MESASKKPASFKTPAFSVPKKIINESKGSSGEKTSVEKVPAQSAESSVPTPAGDNQTNLDKIPCTKTVTAKGKEPKASVFSVRPASDVTSKGDNEKAKKKEKKPPKAKSLDSHQGKKEKKQVKDTKKEHEATFAEKLKSEDKAPNTSEVVVSEGSVSESGDKISAAVTEASSLKTEVPEAMVKTDSSKCKTCPESNEVPREKSMQKLYTKKKVNTDNQPKKASLPVRSLSDEEYEAIFAGALQTAMDINIDEWVPKISDPPKAKKTLKGKYCVTVGKKKENGDVETKKKQAQDIKVKSESEKLASKSSAATSCIKADTADVTQAVRTEANKGEGTEEAVDDAEEDNDENNNVRTGDDPSSGDDTVAEKDGKQGGPDEDGKQGDPDKDEKQDDPDKDEKQEDPDKGEKQDDSASVSSEDQPAEQDPQQDTDEEIDADRESAAQVENEVTPSRNVVDVESVPDGACNSPPPKKKKVVKKEKQLIPKKLMYPQSSSKQEKMKNKIKKLKKICRDSKPSHNDHGKIGDIKVNRKRMMKKATEDCVAVDLKPGKKIKRKKLMQQRDMQCDGTWVQCISCSKWRHLLDVQDPSLIAEKWTCNMNANVVYNSCEKDEEAYDETDHIYTKFSEGSVVWAKMAGYPWWPAMVEIDPDSQSYCDVDAVDSMTPTHYHNVFFDEKVSRAWVPAAFLKKFTGDQQADGIIKISSKARKHAKDISAASQNALCALKCDLTERIKTFGFAARFKGPWGNSDSLDQEQVEVKPTRRKKAEVKCSVRDEDETLLDDYTMDEVIDNTDSLLDNVESLLDSLDSNIDEDEPDSPEIIPVKKMRKPSKTQKPASKESKGGQSEVVMETGDEVKSTTQEDGKKSASKCLKFDSDIFTTEMSDSETDADHTVSDKLPVDDTTADEENIVSDMTECTDGSCDTKKKSDENSKSGSSSVGKDDLINKQVKTKPVKNETEEIANVPEEAESENNIIEESADKITEERQDKVADEFQNNDDTSDGELNSSIENNNDVNTDGEDVTEAEELEINLEEDSLVPDVSQASEGITADKTSARNESSLNDDEDEDFDLVEHSLYDPREDIEDKVQETIVTVLLGSMVDTAEDSDPFDLMEE